MNDYLYLAVIITLELLNYLLVYMVVFHARLKTNKSWLLCLLVVYAVVFGIKIVTGNNSVEKYIILLGIIMSFTSFNGRIKSWISLYPAVAMLTSVFLVLITYVFALVYGKTYMEMIHEPVFVLQSEATFAFIMLIIFWYCKKKENMLFEISLKKNQYALLYTYTVFSVIVLAFTENISSDYQLPLQYFNLYGIGIAGICLLCLVYALWNGMILFNKREQEYQFTQLNTFMRLQEKQFNSIIRSDEKLRAYRHDMKAHFLALQAMNNEKNQPEIAEYIRKNITESEIFHTVSYTGNVAVDAILQNLREEAEKQGITVNYMCRMTEKNSVTVYDLCTILYNLLSNAIEACRNTTAKKEITLKINSAHERLFISAVNTTDSPAVIKKGVLATTKAERHHGLGSRNVRLVVKQYGGSIEYRNEDGWFLVEILL